MMEDFDFSLVPEWYPLCVHSQCPRSGECMRRLVVEKAPQAVEVWPMVMPKTWQEEGCRFFAEVKKQRLVRGFSTLFDRVLKKDSAAMHQDLYDHFHGSRQAYWYMNGERALSQEDEQWLRKWLRRWGYEWEMPFDGFEDVWQFDYVTYNKD